MLFFFFFLLPYPRFFLCVRASWCLVSHTVNPFIHKTSLVHIYIVKYPPTSLRLLHKVYSIINTPYAMQISSRMVIHHPLSSTRPSSQSPFRPVSLLHHHHHHHPLSIFIVPIDRSMPSRRADFLVFLTCCETVHRNAGIFLVGTRCFTGIQYSTIDSRS